MIATAPGKLIVSGEYAVLDGAPAVVVAVTRRAIARRGAPQVESAFLGALAELLELRFDVSARDIVVDSSAFYDGAQKLGLGSSAAVTVAAARLALPEVDRDALFALASDAHTKAQGGGSGADIAASIHGGTIAFTPTADPHRPAIRTLVWPEDIRVIAFFTGNSASTADLVARVSNARAMVPNTVDAAVAAIADASHALVDALSGVADGHASVRPGQDVVRPGQPASRTPDIIATIARAGAAMDQLAAATRVPVVPDCVIAARRALAAFGGAVKTTGAGGGDVAIAVVPATADLAEASRLLVEVGCQPLQLSVDPIGVDTRAGAQ